MRSISSLLAKSAGWLLRTMALAAMFGPSVALALTPPTAVFPPQAGSVLPVALPDLIFQSLPAEGADLVGWDHLIDSQVHWVTNGYDALAAGAERTGFARVRVAGRTSTLLRQRREELAWTVTLATSANPKFGPKTIEISPGASNEQCFGSLTDNCAFTEDEALASLK